MGANPKIQNEAFHVFEQLKNDQRGYQKLRAMLKDWTGISIDEGEAGRLKMANRLSRVLVRYRVSTFHEYAQLLSKQDPHMIAEFISALTTNTTRFFREGGQFESLKNVLQEICESKSKNENKEIRIWCAACSTGQEAYTLALTIRENLKNPASFPVKILATDIDLRALNKAADGIYSAAQLADMPRDLLSKYFTPLEDYTKPQYQVGKELKRMLRFAPFNLHTAKYPFQHKFDIVFCRNVLFYFSQSAATTVVEKLIKSTSERGYLFVGHTEVGFVHSPKLKMVEYGMYQRVGKTKP